MAESRITYSSSESEEENSGIDDCRKQLENVKLSPTKEKSNWLSKFRHKKDKTKGSESCKKKTSTVPRLDGAAVLITAITAGDVDRSRQIIELTSLRSLNKLHVVPVNNEGTFKVTPLLWAVIHSQTEIVKLLIEKGVSLDRQGYLENDSVLHTYTPLTRALDNVDRDIVRLLIEGGADLYLRVSGPKIAEEEGGVVRYLAYLYPLNKAITTDDLEIVSMFMEKVDPLTVLKGDCHTCLCLSLYKKSMTNWYNIVKCIICYGGKVCAGSEKETKPKDKGICSLFKLLIRNTFSLKYFMEEKIVFECNFTRYKVLSLVSKTDYMRPGASIGAAIKQYFRIYDKDKFKYGRYSFECKETEKCYLDMMDYYENPASLKQICRIVIRGSVSCWRPSTCRQLPLPSSLQSFVGYLDDQ